MDQVHPAENIVRHPRPVQPEKGDRDEKEGTVAAVNELGDGRDHDRDHRPVDERVAEGDDHAHQAVPGVIFVERRRLQEERPGPCLGVERMFVGVDLVVMEVLEFELRPRYRRHSGGKVKEKGQDEKKQDRPDHQSDRAFGKFFFVPAKDDIDQERAHDREERRPFGHQSQPEKKTGEEQPFGIFLVEADRQEIKTEENETEQIDLDHRHPREDQMEEIDRKEEGGDQRDPLVEQFFYQKIKGDDRNAAEEGRKYPPAKIIEPEDHHPVRHNYRGKQRMLGDRHAGPFEE